MTQGFILVRVHGTLYVQFEVDLLSCMLKFTRVLIIACNVQIEGSLPRLIQSRWIRLQDPIGFTYMFPNWLHGMYNKQSIGADVQIFLVGFLSATSNDVPWFWQTSSSSYSANSIHIGMIYRWRGVHIMDAQLFNKYKQGYCSLMGVFPYHLSYHKLGGNMETNSKNIFWAFIFFETQHIHSVYKYVLTCKS